jgi:hypothetical protein
MTGGDQRKSLWADPLADEPERESDVVARVLPDDPEPSPPRAHPRKSVRPRAFALGMLGAIVVVALATAQAGGGSLAVDDVPSAWNEVPMTCKTARFEQGRRALELFRCHALGGGTLPPGVYRSPDSLWTSDITRRDARANVMEISPEGELRGWAAY